MVWIRVDAYSIQRQLMTTENTEDHRRMLEFLCDPCIPLWLMEFFNLRAPAGRRRRGKSAQRAELRFGQRMHFERNDSGFGSRSSSCCAVAGVPRSPGLAPLTSRGLAPRKPVRTVPAGVWCDHRWWLMQYGPNEHPQESHGCAEGYCGDIGMLQVCPNVRDVSIHSKSIDHSRTASKSHP